MTQRNPQGVVLAMAAPHPDQHHRQVTVYWRGPTAPTRWSLDQHDAVRFVDEQLALHTLNVVAPKPDRGRVWTVPALHARNGGPTTPVITAAPDGTSPPPREEAPEPVQGDLFGALGTDHG